MRIVGLDLSLRATGHADEDGARVITSKLRGCDRLIEVRDRISRNVDWWILDAGDFTKERPARGKVKADLVVIEDYAFSRGDSHAHGLGELGGVVKVALAELSIATVLVSPSALKKFATGKGNANKVAMGMAASKAGYDGPEDDNAIDAWWLRQMGLYATEAKASDGYGCVGATAYRDDATSKVEWPTIGEAVAS